MWVLATAYYPDLIVLTLFYFLLTTGYLLIWTAYRRPMTRRGRSLPPCCCPRGSLEMLEEWTKETSRWTTKRRRRLDLNLVGRRSG